MKIASLLFLIFMIAMDLAWVRATMTLHKSVLWLDAPAFDIGVLPMANAIAIGLFFTTRRRRQPSRLAVGAMVGGAIGLALHVIACRYFSDRVRDALGPIYSFWGWWSRGKGTTMPAIYLYLADLVIFLPPQILLAAVGALIAWCFAPARPDASAPADDSAGGEVLEVPEERLNVPSSHT